jgi:hypothetical protein
VLERAMAREHPTLIKRKEAMASARKDPIDHDEALARRNHSQEKRRALVLARAMGRRKIILTNQNAAMVRSHERALARRKTSAAKDLIKPLHAEDLLKGDKYSCVWQKTIFF